ncbi:hypothetical protein [Tessaracoccus coleopterorum]|uniref:hypothetical protein n=1 Tax=Tessaracoccus coleopterorum TaxID=2714950 RepID=UPI001E33E5C2|nr:hypothetical protein [Tessaracoccus coleopterorum]
MRAQALEPDGDGVRVVTGDGDQCADAVVLALDTSALQSVVGASDRIGSPGWRAGISRLRVAPAFAVGRRWLARPQPDLPAFLGTSGYGPLDNVSRLDAFEDGAAAWARRHRGR